MRKFIFAPAMLILILVASVAAAQAACTLPYPTFSSGTTADASQVNANFSTVAGCTTVPVATRQVFTSGSSATYTTPANVRQIRIRMWGGGGGGSGSGSSPGTVSAGSDTIFNSIHAAGGGAASNSGTAGGGGAAGAGSASIRMAGAPGNVPAASIWTSTTFVIFGGAGGGLGGGIGGGTPGGAATSGGNAVANTGGGGGGGSNAYATQSTLAAYSTAAGGGEGEYVELIINTPSATYTYTVGSGGSGGNAGTSGAAGGAGGSGIIIVDEYY